MKIPTLPELASMSDEQLAALTTEQRQALARMIQVPVDAFDKVVSSENNQMHPYQQCPHAINKPKGLHPEMNALLQDCAEHSISSLSEEELRQKHMGDQLRAICKDQLYSDLTEAIDEVWASLWPVLDGWQQETGQYLGTLKEVQTDDRRTIMSLVPLGEQEIKVINDSPDIEALIMQLMHYTRRTWGAAVMQWSQEKMARTGRDQFLPGYLTGNSPQPVPLKVDLWRGVNTAIKLNYSINYLLLKLVPEIKSEEEWLALQSFNYSFAALWAAGSVTTLEVLTARLGMSPTREVFDYFVKNNVVNTSEYRLGETGFELLNPDYFRVRGDEATKMALDLNPERMSEVRQMPISADVIVKKCPALKNGVIKDMFIWVNKVVNHALKESGRAPWLNS